MIKFEAWLTAQQGREDGVGALARILIAPEIVSPSSTCKKDEEHKNWANIVVKMAEPGAVPAFNDAWQEFILYKQAVQAVTES